MAGVLIFGDLADGKLTSVSMEVATVGARLAATLGEPLLGALVGDNAAGAAAQFCGGFASLYVVEGRHCLPYSADACMAAAQAVIATCSPSIVLFAHTLQTREWVPRLAARLDTGLVTDCTMLAMEGRELVVTKPVYGGGVWGEFVVCGAPSMATVRAAVFAPQQAAAAKEIVHLTVPAPKQGRVTFLEEVTTTSAGGPRLKDAKIIVSGGRGLGGSEHWHLVEETAAALGAAVGCSRPVADAGWAPSLHQIGLSGTLVAPDLYVAIGISGAVQHLAGISAAKTVIAINTDEDADIFTRANYGVVGDCRDVLPAFVARVRQLRS